MDDSSGYFGDCPVLQREWVKTNLACKKKKRSPHLRSGLARIPCPKEKPWDTYLTAEMSHIHSQTIYSLLPGTEKGHTYIHIHTG